LFILFRSGLSKKLEGIMFCKNDANGYKEVLPGIKMKALVYGEKTLMSEFYLEVKLDTAAFYT